MKGGGEIYPNKGVKIDPRAITSARMPESLKVYSGYLFQGYIYLKDEGILTRSDIEKESDKIECLPPLCKTKSKLLSSHWFRSDTYLIEFLRTTAYNYKIYALRILFIEESRVPFHN
jgi:hypothetical protein